MAPPTTVPIGLQLTRTARVVGQAFDRAMAAVGGSAATWQVHLRIRSRQWGQQ
jgi:MarR family transcriptional regulator for hemolysin